MPDVGADESLLDSALSIIKITGDGKNMGVIVAHSFHLQLLNLRDASVRIEHHDLGALLTGETLKRCAACISGCSNHDESAFIASCQ